MWHCSVWSSELWQLWYADLLQVCPQLRHHPIWQVPPGRVTDLMSQATNPNNGYQSISIVLRENIIGFNFFNFRKKNTIIANLHKPLQWDHVFFPTHAGRRASSSFTEEMTWPGSCRTHRPSMPSGQRRQLDSTTCSLANSSVHVKRIPKMCQRQRLSATHFLNMPIFANICQWYVNVDQCWLMPLLFFVTMSTPHACLEGLLRCFVGEPAAKRVAAHQNVCNSFGSCLNDLYKRFWCSRSISMQVPSWSLRWACH